MEKRLEIQGYLEGFVKRNYLRIAFNVSFFVALYMFSKLPYLNIVFDFRKAAYLSFLLGTLLYRFKSKNLVLFGIIFIIMSIPVTLVNLRPLSDILNMFAYICFLVATFKKLNEVE